MSGWLYINDRHIVLSRNIVDIDQTEHNDNWPASERKWHYRINAFDTGGRSRILWRSKERDMMDHLSTESRAEADGMLRHIADHFANDRTGTAT